MPSEQVGYTIQYVDDRAPYIVLNEEARTPTLVRVAEWQGTLRIDVRQIWSPKDTNEWVLTKKGAVVPIEELDELIEFLLSVKAALDNHKEEL